jgi:hypothetical protein
LTREKWKRLKDEVLSQFLISNMSIDNYAFSESHVIDFERIRQSHPLVAYCENQGIDLRRSSCRRVGKCPLHNEQNGTAFVLHPDEKWQCFGKCSRQGDVVDVEMLLDEIRMAANSRQGTVAKDLLPFIPDDEDASKGQIHAAINHSGRLVGEKKVKNLLR